MKKIARKEAKTEAQMLRVLGDMVWRELREFVVVAGMSAACSRHDRRRG
jgi:hypothetical protein